MRVCCNSTANGRIYNIDGSRLTIDDISNPLDYYNNPQLQNIRKKMINGERTSECNICYAVEDTGGVSVRQIFVNRWPMESVIRDTELSTGKMFSTNINYLDLSWSNKCNLQCKMCTPNASDQLINEAKLLDLSINSLEWNFKDRWQYDKIKSILEKIVTLDLTDILVTGGEPLINNDFYEFCKMLKDNNVSKNIGLSFHTNLTVTPSKWLDMLLNFKYVSIKVSIDAVEDMYEYVRYPGKWNIVDNNIKQLIEYSENNPSISIEFHTVFSIYNTHKFINLLDYVLNISNSKYVTEVPHLNYIYYPDYASPSNLPDDYKVEIADEIKNWISINRHRVTKKNAIQKISIIESMLEIMLTTTPSSLQIDKSRDVIRKTDNYRKHDTKIYLPWWEN
jgi:molybdenum cofactor biosynthesis enzyme MoaA